MCLKFNFWNGWSICKPFKLACLLLCCLLKAIDSEAQSATNVDFIVVGSSYWLDGQYVYDTIPTGCILFWSIKPDDAERAPIYRSESGHIAFVQRIDAFGYGSEDWLVLADSSGSPMPWFVNSGWRRSYKISVEGGGSVTKYAVYPGKISKYAFDCIPCNSLTGTGCTLLYLVTRPVFADTDFLSRSGNIGFAQHSFTYNDKPMAHGYVYGTALDYSWQYDGNKPKVIGFDDGSSEAMQLRWAFRASSFEISLDAFKSHLPSKWWMTKKFTVSPGNGIIAINVPGGTGMGGQGDGENSGPAAPSEGGPGVGGSVPGDITNPPSTPMGQNGKWVYDPETKMWNWQGDYADNADQLNPWDNSVMPENQERGLAQEATLRKVEAGIEKIRMTLEDFQKQQGVTPDQLQAMIDNAVVEIVDGQVQYWQGQNLVGAINNIADKVEEVKENIDNSASSAANQVAESIQQAANKNKSAVDLNSTYLWNFKQENHSDLRALQSTVTYQGGRIVDAINDLEAPTVDVPSTDEQTIDNCDAPVGDVGSLGNELFGLSMSWLPVQNLPVVREFPDWDVGVFDWVIPFSHFSYSKNPRISNILYGVREFLSWLCWVTLVVGCVRSIVGGD